MRDMHAPMPHPQAPSPSLGKRVIMRDGKVYSSYVSEVLARKQYPSV